MRGGTPRAYPHPKYAAWLRETGQWWDEQQLSPTDALLSVDVLMFFEKPKTGKLLTPKGDLDNLVKGPMDAATGRLWVDDRQVVELHCSKEYVPHGTAGYHVMNVAEV